MDRKNQTPQGETARILVEFLEVAITSIIFLKGIYPPEAFERRRYMNVVVQRARHPQLADYIHSVTSGLFPSIQKEIKGRQQIIVKNLQQSPAKPPHTPLAARLSSMTCHLPIRPRTQTLFPAPNYSLKIKNGQTNQKGRRKQRGSPIPKTLVFRFNSFPPNSPPDPSSPAIIGCFLAILLPIGRDLLFPLLFTPRSRFAGSVSAMSPGAALMETSKPTDSSAMEARFADLCKNTELALGESLEKQAMILFKETIHILSANVRAIGAGSTDEMERLWSAFVLYSVVRLGLVREKENSGVTLPRILKAAKLKFGDFIKEMPQFSVKAGFLLSGLYDPDWEKKLELKELQASIEHLSLLRRHFKRSYHEYFVPGETSSNHHSISDSAEFMSDYHRFGWLLFLALRVHHFGPFKDLVTCTNGLVSIMAILILHVPARLRKFSIQDSTPFAKKSDKGVNLLASLSDICHTSEDELRITMGKVNKLIVDVLKKKPCPASECKRENLEHIDPDGLMYFEDLLEDNSLQSCLSILEKDYDDVISTKGELDEHMFANDDSCLLGTCSLSGTPLNVSGTKRKFDVFASPSKTIKSPLSPTCSPAPSRNGNHVGNFRVPSTPVSTAMTTAKWLRTVISPLSSTPSAELGRFLSSCDKDVTGDVTRRANIILEAIFPSNYGERCTSGCENMSQMDNSWAERRKMEALKLYYRILEAICRTESHTTNNLSSLLSTERFHRCMLACSAELVLASYKTITMAFPAVLEKTGITAFDLSKMIECFVRHEETLPRELKRHLNYLEERLLESMVWEKGSSMYNSLIVARADLSEEISRLDLLAEPLPSLDVIAMQHNIHLGNLPTLPFHKCDTSPDHNGDAQSPKGTNGEYRTVLVERNSFMSPVKERLLTFNSLKSKMAPLQSVFASPNRRNPAGDDTCGAAGINSFFSKILKLAAIRIRSLCDRLQLSQKILERIYFLIQKIVSHRTALFFNRHIDQIILCCFYGVAKISQLSLTFKDIIYNYKKQSQCKPQVFRSVYVNWPPTSRNGKSGEEHVDIITFYNEIFIPCAKPLLVELGPSDDTKKNNRNHEDKNDADGQIPGSPRFSPFPNLPDMSPKKVSAAHNIYVSPLRSSKMDSMLSPSSKSYYACIGESTHAFQSPSKDLTAINNRLNCGGRKIGGRLNFDMVSDSVVAGSLVPSTANLNNLSAKSEPDSQ